MKYANLKMMKDFHDLMSNLKKIFLVEGDWSKSNPNLIFFYFLDQYL